MTLLEVKFMVPSRILLSATAILLAIGGGGMLFAPDTALRLLVTQPGAPGWPVQLLAAAWWGFAALNWASRGTVVGGIYGRPLVVANFTHFLIATLVLLRAALSAMLGLWMWILLLVLALLAGAFGLRLFVGPPEREFANARTG